MCERRAGGDSVVTLVFLAMLMIDVNINGIWITCETNENVIYNPSASIIIIQGCVDNKIFTDGFEE